MSRTRPTPNILWRLAVIAGMGTLTAVSVDDGAWEAFDDATGGTIPRDALRTTLGVAVGLHAAEGASAWVSARRAGLRHPAWWGLSTLMWGFPVLLRLRRAKKAAT